MPYVKIQITREGATRKKIGVERRFLRDRGARGGLLPRIVTTSEQKAQLIRETTDMLARVLDMNPAATIVVIEEVETDHRGIAGETVTALRHRHAGDYL